MKKFLVISNDQINVKNKIISAPYNDTINILEILNKYLKINLLSRFTNKKQKFPLQIKKKIKITHIINLIFSGERFKIFMISITPRNFFNFIFLKIFLKQIEGYVYLRSNGYEEYKKILGKLGPFIYDIMFKIISKDLKIITVSKTISYKKSHSLIIPSELDNFWFKNLKTPRLEYPKILYVGRFRKEKGVFSLLNLFNKINFKYELSIVGLTSKLKSNNKQIKFSLETNSKKKLIKLYDDCNIFILPSYTEGSPKVILESLARKRPVIIFNEIKHVVSNFKGVYICKRNIYSLKKNITYILKNYKYIQLQMRKNNLPSKNDFQKNLFKILNE